jgi:hypothetical protein
MAASLPEDRKLPITELKWDARTVTDIPGNNAYWFFAFFWLTKGSKNAKNQFALLPGISVTVLASHFSFVIGNFRSSAGQWFYIIYSNQGAYRVLLYIFIKQRYVQTFWGIIHVCGISVTVLASHFSSVISNFRSSGRLDLHVWYLKTFVKASAW